MCVIMPPLQRTAHACLSFSVCLSIGRGRCARIRTSTRTELLSRSARGSKGVRARSRTRNFSLSLLRWPGGENLYKLTFAHCTLPSSTVTFMGRSRPYTPPRHLRFHFHLGVVPTAAGAAGMVKGRHFQFRLPPLLRRLLLFFIRSLAYARTHTIRIFVRMYVCMLVALCSSRARASHAPVCHVV